MGCGGCTTFLASSTAIVKARMCCSCKLRVDFFLLPTIAFGAPPTSATVHFNPQHGLLCHVGFYSSSSYTSAVALGPLGLVMLLQGGLPEVLTAGLTWVLLTGGFTIPMRVLEMPSCNFLFPSLALNLSLSTHFRLFTNQSQIRISEDF
jgi:hypothetical protein